jgi:hypothetical protein
MQRQNEALQRELRQRDAATNQARERHEMAIVQRENDRRAAVLSEFMADKPDVATIEVEMAAMITSIMDANPRADIRAVLQHAYDAARYANPQTRAKILAEDARKNAEATRQAKTAAVVKARKTNAVNVTASHNSTPEPDFETMRLELARQHGLK